ncbi:MAG: hypothetical protein IT364_25165 [Candidatus Hydrogenedentes bacterium]|nr:hypothetical protein [Candidatus Hydrogenedentota bacterium]
MSLQNLVTIVSSLACVTLFTGCPVTPPMTDAELAAAFQAAVDDAEVAEAAEICRTLTAIVPVEESLIWEGTPGESRVLVVTWTSYTGYDDQVGKSIAVADLLKSVETTRDTWVTVAPQVQDFCGKLLLNDERMTLRVEQLLGLPPHNGKTRFVEFWVDPQDLFRPSPDPAITDHEAELDFPQSSLFVAISPGHVTWYENMIATSYGTGGYPWTRLGYTFDWGNPVSEVGLSEFVIRTGATVTVKSVTLNSDYWR